MRRPARIVHVLAVAMFVSGAACIAWAFLAWTEARAVQLAARARLGASVALSLPAPMVLPDAAAPVGVEASGLVGWLEVPRLAVSLGVFEGDDDRTLRVGAGHLPDTPMPWEYGNSALAGHRDTFFRALRGLRIGDDVSMVTARGTFDYRVTRVRIVRPDDLSVLAFVDGVDLTLITCYPFTYVGRAPQRYVVQAARTRDERGE